MMQYPNQNYQNSQMCNTENCKRCPRKQGCTKYLSYLENIASTPIPMVSPTLSNIAKQAQSDIDKVSVSQPSIDLSSIEELISSYQTSISEFITANSTNIENKLKMLLEINNELVAGLLEMKNAIFELNEKISKLDSFIEMIEIHNAQAGNFEPKENSMTIYSDIPEPEKILVEKSKKGFLGFGKKTEWVEE